MRKKILFIIDHLGIGGVQEFILNYVKIVKEHQVTVLSLFGADIYSQKLRAAGAEVIFLSDLPYNYFNVATFRVFLSFKRYLDNNINCFDAVHIKLFASFLYASLLRLYVHEQVSAGLDASKYQLPFVVRSLYRIFANKYKKFYLADYLWQEYDYIDKNRLVNQAYFITMRYSIHPVQYPHLFALLSIGRCIEQKGFLDVIKVFEKIQELSEIDVGLYIIGEGNYKDKLIEYVKNRNIRNVYFTGNVLNLDDYLESASMIIKMAKAEGINSVVRESLMMGKWVASTIETVECQRLLEKKMLIPLKRDDFHYSAQMVIKCLENLQINVKSDYIISNAKSMWSDDAVIKSYLVEKKNKF